MAIFLKFVYKTNVFFPVCVQKYIFAIKLLPLSCVYIIDTHAQKP